MLQDNTFYIIAGIVFALIFGGIALWWFLSRKASTLQTVSNDAVFEQVSSSEIE